MNFNRRILIPLAALVVIAAAILASGSHATDTTHPTVTPANDQTATSPETVAVATAPQEPSAATVNPPPAQPAKPGCDACWVQIFDDKGFDVTDDNHMICGPGKYPNLRHLNGAAKINWGDEIESLKVGPGAVVTVWTGEQFTGASHTFSPGTEKMTLKDLPGFSDGISSMEIKHQ